MGSDPEYTRIMRSVLAGSRLDRAGVIASSVCAVHCVLGALVLGAPGALASVVESEHLERGLVLVAVIIAVAAATFGYQRHGDAGVVALVLGGVAMAVVTMLSVAELVPDPILSVGVAVLFIGAHARNASLLQRHHVRCNAGCAAGPRVAA
jgi:hypothetical protein